MRLTNYRPISLLGTIYKILAKLMANRLIDLLPKWIKPSQTAFVKGRCIFDNVFLAYESMEWALESNQPLTLLLLDFEKTYDRVNWRFLKETMAHMGFSEKWVNLVMTLYSKATTCVTLNGT